MVRPLQNVRFKKVGLMYDEAAGQLPAFRRSNCQGVNLKSLICFFGLVALTAAVASADIVSYNTTGSTLSCNGIAGCVQDTSTSITDGGLTLTYSPGSGSDVVTPSIINLGNITSGGTGADVTMTGLLLTINVNSTPPGKSGSLPNGAVLGSLSTDNSGAIIEFSPNNTTTTFGTLPGVVIAGYTYQVLNTTLGLQAPTIGNPIGQTSIQGAVTGADFPEPVTALPMLGLSLIFVWRLRATR